MVSASGVKNLMNYGYGGSDEMYKNLFASSSKFSYRI